MPSDADQTDRGELVDRLRDCARYSWARERRGEAQALLHEAAAEVERLQQSLDIALHDADEARSHAIEPDAELIARLRGEVERLEGELEDVPELRGCPFCDFRYDADHCHDEGTYSCPNCAEIRLREVGEAIDKFLDGWCPSGCSCAAQVAPLHTQLREALKGPSHTVEPTIARLTRERDEARAERKAIEAQDEPYVMSTGWERGLHGDLDGEALCRYARKLETERAEARRKLETPDNCVRMALSNAELAVHNAAEQIGALQTDNTRLRAALEPVLDAIMQSNSDVFVNRESWNENAHIEITLSVGESWQIHDALTDPETGGDDDQRG